MGKRQSGLPEFRIGNLARDQQIVEKARKAAEFYLAKRERSVETKRMIQRVQVDPRFGLAAIG
jgi:RecG-like helicase